MPRSFRLSIAAAALLAISAGSLPAGAPATSRTSPELRATKVACRYYAEYGFSGGSVICFGPNGAACAICPL